jgi:hypothetical protein
MHTILIIAIGAGCAALGLFFASKYFHSKKIHPGFESALAPVIDALDADRKKAMGELAGLLGGDIHTLEAIPDAIIALARKDYEKAAQAIESADYRFHKVAALDIARIAAVIRGPGPKTP